MLTSREDPISTSRTTPTHQTRLLSVGLTLALVTSSAIVVTPADADDTEDALAQAQSALEETAATYDEVLSQIESLETQIADNQQRIAVIERDLPAQQAASDKSLVALYKMSQEGMTLIDLLLGAKDFNEFTQTLEYITRVQEQNAQAVSALASMKSELESSQKQLSEARADLELERVAAEDALSSAQAAREAAQAAAEEKQRRDAEAIAAGKVEEAAIPVDANAGSTVTGEPQETITGPATNDNVDWSQDKASFVEEWGGRIDAYLSGSPLSGYGSTFAEAAWDYGVDPRFSPAISCIESGKGTYCFRNHNAWGWGSVDWDSWEEAIFSHVRGLSRGYGYTVTVEGAQKYCPPNWEFWYNNVSAQMTLI